MCHDTEDGFIATGEEASDGFTLGFICLARLGPPPSVPVVSRPGRFTLSLAEKLGRCRVVAQLLCFPPLPFCRLSVLSTRGICTTAIDTDVERHSPRTLPPPPPPPLCCTCAAVVGAKLLLSLNGRSKTLPELQLMKANPPHYCALGFYGPPPLVTPSPSPFPHYVTGSRDCSGTLTTLGQEINSRLWC